MGPWECIGLTVAVKGRDLINGVPKEIMISQMEIAEAISEPVGRIVDTVRIALENTQPELADDIVDQGIVLTGGGALQHGMDTILPEASGMPVSIEETPMICVALGVGDAVGVTDRESVGV